MSIGKTAFIISFLFTISLLGHFKIINFHKFQALCVSNLPQLNYQDSLSALLCGKNLNQGHENEVLTRVGLIHLFVVSGSHLIFLEQILLAFGASQSFVGVTLFIFLMMTGFTAPALRAFLYWIISRANISEKWNWSPNTRAFIAGLLSFVLLLGQQRFSLLLSWNCSVILIFFQTLKLESLARVTLQQISITSTLTFVYFAQSGNPLWPLLANLIAMFFIEWLIFPLAIVTLVLRITKLYDWSFYLLYKILESIPNTRDPIQLKKYPGQLLVGFLVILAFHLITHVIYVEQKRESA